MPVVHRVLRGNVAIQPIKHSPLLVAAALESPEWNPGARRTGGPYALNSVIAEMDDNRIESAAFICCQPFLGGHGPLCFSNFGQEIRKTESFCDLCRRQDGFTGRY